MREIRFRGYDGTDWVYSMTIDYNKKTNTYCMFIEGKWVPVRNVGQYTGLMDDRGIRVFEGDIVKTVDGLKEHTSEVFMHPYGVYIHAHPSVKGMTGREIENLYHYCDYGDGRGISQQCFVIGNTHDNPALSRATRLQNSGEKDFFRPGPRSGHTWGAWVQKSN